MSIRRGGNRPNDHYTIVTNRLARDAGLSFKARGVALYLLSHTEGFRTTAETIAKANGCGVEQVRTALRELEERGYITRDQPRDDQGRLGPIEYVITDLPQSSVSGKPDTGPDLRKHPPDEDVSAGRDRDVVSRSRITRSRETTPYKKNKGLEEQVREEQEEHNRSNTSPRSARASLSPREPDLFGEDQPADERPPGPAPDPDPFEAFWRVYPRHVAKADAHKAWRAALKHKVSARTIIDAAGRYAEAVRDGDPRYVKYPASWLRAACYDDDPTELRLVHSRSSPGPAPYRNPVDQSAYYEPITTNHGAAFG